MSELRVQKKETGPTRPFLISFYARRGYCSAEAVEGQKYWRDSERNSECGCRQQARQRRAEGAEPLLSSWHIHMAQSLSVILDRVQKYSSAALPLRSFHGAVKINPLYHWGWNAEPLFFFHNVRFQAGYVSVPGIMWVTVTVKHWQRVVF